MENGGKKTSSYPTTGQTQINCIQQEEKVHYVTCSDIQYAIYILKSPIFTMYINSVCTTFLALPPRVFIAFFTVYILRYSFFLSFFVVMHGGSVGAPSILLYNDKKDYSILLTLVLAAVLYMAKS